MCCVMGYTGHDLSAAKFKDYLLRTVMRGPDDQRVVEGPFGLTFSDNIERAHKSGVKYIAQPGGSVRDDAVIECADKYDMVMSFTGIRLFHH